jgi:hypothetical protein
VFACLFSIMISYGLVQFAVILQSYGLDLKALARVCQHMDSEVTGHGISKASLVDNIAHEVGELRLHKYE